MTHPTQLSAKKNETTADGFDATSDFYRLLEIHPEASPEVLHKAYRALVQKYHPDQYHVRKKERMEARMKAINLAYDTLSDPVRRRQYDRQRQVQHSVAPQKKTWRNQPLLWLGGVAVILLLLKMMGRALIMMPAGKILMLAGALTLLWVWQNRRRSSL